MKHTTYYPLKSAIITFAILFGFILWNITGFILFGVISSFILGYYISDWGSTKIKLAILERKR